MSRGVPSVTYLRVLGPSGMGQGDIITDGSNALTVVESGYPSTRHEVAQVLDKGMSDEEVCEMTIGNQAGAGIGAVLNPITAFVNDAATIVITIVGSRSTKKSLFLKRIFLPFIANELFNNISEREHHTTSGFYQAAINMSSFEIQDEVISDLLRPSTRGMAVSMTAEDGVGVVGVHKELISDEQTLRKAFADACDNRATSTMPVGASLDTSTAVWEIELRQTEVGDASSGSVRKCYSRLVLVDLPATDPLVQGNADLRQLHSPTLHKSLITFLDVCKKLSTPSRAALAPFRSSRLTHYLSEMLGGNAIVVGLGILCTGEPAVSRKTLEVIGALTSAVHYPIGGRELTEILQGLLCKYRSLVLQLQDEILNGKPIGEKEEFTTEKILQIQRDLAVAIMERNVAKEDGARLFEMMELIKAKYSTIVKEKGAQSQELIKAEEDKLSIARALVELKLQYSQLQEKAEKDKFDLTSALLTAKNEYFDLDAQLLLAKTESGISADVVKETENLHRLAMDDVAGLRASLQETRDRLAREEDKNVELGSELLTLVNQKEALSLKTRDLQGKLDQAVLRVTSFEKQGDDTVNALEQLRLKYRHIEDDLQSSKRTHSDTELDLRRTTMDLDRLTKESESTIAELMKAVEVEKIKADEQRNTLLRQAAEEKKKMENDFINKTSGKTVEVIPLAEAKATQNKLERRIRDMERELKRTSDDNKQLSSDKTTLEKEHNALKISFRNKLSSLLIEDDRAGTPQQGVAAAMKSSKLGSSKGAPMQGSRQEPEALVQDLLQSYQENEKRMRQDLEHATTTVGIVSSAMRGLFDKYRSAIDSIEDYLPTVANPLWKDELNEFKMIGEAALNNVSGLVEKGANYDQESTKNRLKTTEDALISEQNRASAILNTYKRNLEKTEKRLAESRMEVASLHAQIRQLIDAKDGSGRDIAKANKLEQQEAMIKVLQEQLTEQLKQLNSPRTVENLTSPEKQGMLQSQKVLSTRETQIELDRINRELFEAGEYISRLEKGAQKAVVEHLRETERRCAGLVGKNIALEEELNTYREYMRSVVLQYKKQVKALREQLQATSGVALPINPSALASAKLGQKQLEAGGNAAPSPGPELSIETPFDSSTPPAPAEDRENFQLPSISSKQPIQSANPFQAPRDGAAGKMPLHFQSSRDSAHPAHAALNRAKSVL